MANMRDDMGSMRDEIRALSTTVLRMDGSVASMAQELGANIWIARRAVAAPL
jgi:hypothetical protein